LDNPAGQTAVKLFATDVNDARHRNGARRSILGEHIADVSPVRLRRFFVKAEGGYQVNKSLRDQCVFARHDVTKNPPFSQLDLISCRNVLIYVDGVLQQRVFADLHYAAEAWGFLVLGGSESVSGFTDLFRVVDRNHKIFARLPTANRRLFAWSPSGELGTPAVAGPRRSGRGTQSPRTFAVKPTALFSINMRLPAW